MGYCPHPTPEPELEKFCQKGDWEVVSIPESGGQGTTDWVRIL